MRGKPSAPNTICCKLRITPADAGKTAVDELYIQDGADHPRGCGENLSAALNQTALYGSPPRMRGKRQHPELALLFHGITPADAGKTL